MLAGRSGEGSVAPSKTYAGLRILGLALLGVLSVSLAIWITFPRMTAVEHLSGGRSGPVDMPWFFAGITNGNRLEVTMPVNWLTPRRWQVIPDDRLTALGIDGQAVPLDRVPPAQLSDWRHGFVIDLSPWLASGTRQLEFTVDNTAWFGHLTLQPRAGWRVPLLAASLLPWLLALARLFRLGRGQTAVLAGSLLLLAGYWAATPWTERVYDVKRHGETGHLGYIEYVARSGSLPRPDQGWEYFQPPLYYAGGALVKRGADWLGLPDTEALRAYTLGLWLVFLAASAATLKLALRRSGGAVLLATAALALWPSGIIDGLRISNDIPLYAAAAVATYFMLRWWRGGRPRHLYGMALAVALALLSKSSAGAVLAAAALLVALRLLRHGRWRQWRPWAQALGAGAVMAAGVVLSLARGVWYWWHGQVASWLIASIGTLDDNLRVPNTLRQFIPLDIPTFLTSPWVTSRDDATGRANFWNFLLRSSLTGEFDFDGRLQRLVAWGWGALLLALLVLLLARAGRLRWKPAALWRELPWVVLSLLWLASVLAVRATYAFSCQADFRFIVPVLVPFLVATVRNGMVARWMLGLIGAGSVLFFATLQ
jgi:hypothetical protein